MRSLGLRLTLLAVAILAVSLGAAIVLAYELLLSAGRGDLDEVLQREQRRFEQSVQATAADRDPATAALPAEQVVRQATAQHLRLFADTDAYLTVTRIGEEMLTAPNHGPEALERLLAAGRLPSGPENRIVTLHTDAGEVRTITAPVLLDGRRVAVFQVSGPLEPIKRNALRSLWRLSGAALISLALGAALMAAVLRAALRPLKGLSDAARVTDLDDLSARVLQANRGDELGILAREFNRMLERLERASAARQEFLATVSHELRTPITISLGHIETLQRLRDRDPATVAEATAVVRDELTRMRVMVEDLLALARSETGDFVVPRPLQLPEFVDDLRLRAAGLQIDGVTFDDQPDAVVYADPDRLAQAVLNLVVNARAHTPPGTSVCVSVTVEDTTTRLTVTDDGPGIDPAIRDHAFEPFVRGSTAAPGGHGLGLAVVRAVAVAHHGRVDVDTAPRGTRITLVLPRATPGGRAPHGIEPTSRKDRLNAR